MFLTAHAAPVEWQMEFPMAQYDQSSDVTEDDVAELVAVANRLDARPHDLAGCWYSESTLHTWAHNPNGNAVGIFQAMPATLKGLGFRGTWADFKDLSFREQLGWAEKYYRPHVGRLTSPGACYLATFLPAFMAHASEGPYVLCSTNVHADWYAANYRAFDPEGKGWITVGDLTRRIERVTQAPRWLELADRIATAVHAADTVPEIPALVMCRGDGETGEG